MNWTGGGGKERAGSNPAPKLPSPSSLLCNLLISFRRETGAHSPREGGGAVLPGRMRGKAAPSPSSPVAGPKSAFSLRQEGRGDSLLQASPAPPRATRPRPPPPAPRGLRSAVRGVPLPSVWCPRGPPPPVLWPCPCPRGGAGARSALPVPLRLRGLHGSILFPRCHWALWRGGGRTWGAPAPALSASLPRASLRDHG